ncbi:MAG: hypothetical protein E7138_06225 [Rikenellaceae bacterium]|nr:hypothetical protein [Rikenellaceae bacterium]MBQ3535533.1 hypothetical protein [Alistipes sp.]MBQ8543577.1 hypothetical protein [Alistipes sp.]MBR3703268.1 hypothetical protein [Alistipes sp.]
MKDTIITAAVKRRELWILLICFVVANIANWVAIIKFSAPWYEVFTQIGYVVVTTLVIYALVTMVRLAFWLIKYISRN